MRRRKTTAKATIPPLKLPKKTVTPPPQSPHVPAKVHGSNNGNVFTVFTLTTTVSLALYTSTLSPTIAGGDAGELVAEGCQLGTPHPPGYPLYTLLLYTGITIAKALTRAILPAGSNILGVSPAIVANGMSAVWGSVASGLLSSSVFRLISSPSPVESSSSFDRMVTSVTIGVLHSLSPLAWQYSVTAEVFALHNLMVTLLISTSINYAVTGRGLGMGGLVCGLALANQHTSLLLEVPLILWILFSTGIFHRGILNAALGFLAGVSLYVLLPVWASWYPHPGSWGNVTSWDGFWHHFLRRDYGTLRLYSGNDDGSEGAWERIGLYAQDFIVASGNNLFVPVFSVVGMGVMLITAVRRPARSSLASGSTALSGVGGVLVVSHVCYLVVFHSLANLPLSNPLLFGIHKRFWLHPHILSFLFTGVGINYTLHSVTDLLFKHTPTIISNRVKTGLVVTFALISLANSYWRHFRVSDQSDNNYFHNYAKGILEALPTGALFFINYDQQWTSVRYFQQCEDVRTDITSINLSMMSYPWWKTKKVLYPHITFPGTHYTNSNRDDNTGFTFYQLLESNYHSHPEGIFVGGRLNYPDAEYNANYIEIPHGMTRRIVKRNQYDSSNHPLSKHDSFRRESLRPWRVISRYHQRPSEQRSNGLPPLDMYPPETWEWTITREFFDHLIARASHLLDLTTRQQQNTKHAVTSLVEAAAWMEYALDNDAEKSATPALMKNLGIAYMNLVRQPHVTRRLPAIDNVFDIDLDSADFRSSSNSVILFRGGERADWKAWASQRWSECWKEFLEMDGARKDESYRQVKKIYNQVMKSARSSGPAVGRG